jgi:hypothetical protein
MTKIILIRFKTKIRDIQAYFIEFSKGKYIPLIIPTGEFVEINEEDIIEKKEVEPDYQGRFRAC